MEVLSSYFYNHKSNDTNAIMKLFNYDNYARFINNANTTMLYRLKNWKLGASHFKQIEIEAKSKLTTLVGLNATKQIFGIGIKYSNINENDLVLEANSKNKGLISVGNVTSCKSP